MEIASLKLLLYQSASHSKGIIVSKCQHRVVLFLHLRFQKMAEEAPRLIKEKRQKIILGVDRLDYTKGLVHRLKAFERFLEKHPEHIEEV